MVPCRANHALTWWSYATTASGYLVFSMQLGFALLTAGCVRAKSAKSVCLKNIMDAAFGGVGYFLFGEPDSTKSAPNIPTGADAVLCMQAFGSHRACMH